MALYKGSIRLAGIGSFPDQIQYMSQDDYDNLSETAKMNGTTYGIVGETEPEPEPADTGVIDSLTRWVKNEPLASGDIAGGALSIPEGANLLVLLSQYYSNARKMFFTIPISFLKTNYSLLPGTAGDMSSNYSGVYINNYDSEKNTITIAVDSSGGKYYFY